MVPRATSTKGTIQKAVLSFEDIHRMVVFLQNYATANPVMLSGQVPGYKRDDIVLLPSKDTKAGIYRLYKDMMKK